MLFDKDIVRLVEHLRMKPGNFIQKYTFMDIDGFYAFQKTPCHFSRYRNYFTVNEYRPIACNEYPHTNQCKMHTLLNLAEKNAEIYPAVQSILLQIENYI